MKISVVTPLYRSAPYIEELCRRTVAAIGATDADDYEIILVNDGSPDDSLPIVKTLADANPKIVGIDLSRNFGQHRALLAGMAHADGDFVFIMDSDLEEDPGWIAQFYNELRRTGCDAVFGVQLEESDGAFYRLGRRLFYAALIALSGIDFPKNVVTARLMSRRYVDALLQYDEREVFLSGIWHMVGFAQCAVRVVKPKNSPSTYNFRKAVGLFINGVTAFSTRPLVAISLMGIFVSLAALIFSGWVIYRKLMFGVAVEGWASVMAATLLIGGATMFFNGIIAIYIAKIFLEVKRRPMSTIREIYKGAGAADKPPDNPGPRHG